MDVCHNPFDLTYRFWGTGLANLLGHERTGKSLLGLETPRIDQAILEYKAVIEERAPFCFVYDVKTSTQWTPLFAPAARLPFSDDNETVHNILTYADFETDDVKWRQFFEGQGET